jgi:hypothetical protein
MARTEHGEVCPVGYEHPNTLLEDMGALRPSACEVQFSHTPKVQQYRAALQDSQVVGKAS